MTRRPNDDRGQMHFRKAADAMKKLLADPEDTSQVFRIVEALSGRSGERLLSRFERSPDGRRLLHEKPDLVGLLQDRAYLEALPPGSLGREYLGFVESEGITAAGLVEASREGRRYRPDEIGADFDFVRNRMRDTHDLWHVVTGYQGDLLGEAALLAFSFAQTRNPGVGFIVAVALLRGREPRVRRLIVQGFARGLRARYLPTALWESWLHLPIGRVREQLRVGPPPEYTPIRTPDLAAEAA